MALCCNEVGATETLGFTSPSANIARVRFSCQYRANSVRTYGAFDNLRYDNGYYNMTVSIVGSGNVLTIPFPGPYAYGSVVTLGAGPSQDWSFSGWSGDFTSPDATIYPLMFSDKTVIATFVPAPQPGPNFIVTTTNDHDDGIAGAVDCTLREAINAANANANNNTITFAPGVVGQITLQLGQLTISHDVTIIGPGAKTLAITVSNISSSFHISGGAIAGISGLNIRNEVVGFNSYTGMTIDGGSSLALTACNVSGFRSTGIFNGGTLSLNSCTIAGNSGDNGGGISNYGFLGVTNSTISGNGASSAGGVYNHPTGTLTLISSTDRKSTRLNSSHGGISRMPSSA